MLLDALRGLPKLLGGLRESGQPLLLIGEALDSGAEVATTFEKEVLGPLSEIERALCRGKYCWGCPQGHRDDPC